MLLDLHGQQGGTVAADQAAFRMPHRSVLRRLRCAQAFEPGATRLRLESAPLRGGGRPGRMARLRWLGRAPDQFDEPFARLLAVALLGAGALGDDDEHAPRPGPPAGPALEAGGHVGMQRRRMAHVEAQLHCRRQLVDILAAGTGRAHEALLDLALVDANALGDADHGGPVIVLAYDSMIRFPNSLLYSDATPS